MGSKWADEIYVEELIAFRGHDLFITESNMDLHVNKIKTCH